MSSSSNSYRHIVVVISSHGYGHAAMTAPVINRLQQLHPHLRITLSTAVPRPFLDSKFNGPFEHLPHSSDFGMIMNSAFESDLPASLRAYHELHDQWQTNIATEMGRLKNIGADMVISNIAYLPLIAAQRLGIPAIAMSCLNWADILEHFFPEEREIHQQIVAAYRSADCFIRTEPAMPMSDFTTHTVAPLTTIGNNCRQQLLKLLQCTPEIRLVLVSMGGINTVVNAQRWPALHDVHYITANNFNTAGRGDITALDQLGISYNDALASCDLLLTKPGYGSFTEAACNGRPVLYVRRDEWPEQSSLTAWLHQHTPCHDITLEDFRNGNFSQPLMQLLQQKPTITTSTEGVEEAATLIATFLKR